MGAFKTSGQAARWFDTSVLKYNGAPSLCEDLWVSRYGAEAVAHGSGRFIL